MMGSSNLEQLEKILQLTGMPKKSDLSNFKETTA